jgi:hypothetical protein
VKFVSRNLPHFGSLWYPAGQDQAFIRNLPICLTPLNRDARNSEVRNNLTLTLRILSPFQSCCTRGMQYHDIDFGVPRLVAAVFEAWLLTALTQPNPAAL